MTQVCDDLPKGVNIIVSLFSSNFETFVYGTKRINMITRIVITLESLPLYNGGKKETAF